MTQYSLPGSNTLLLGATGTGKTHSLQTLLDAGISPFVFFTESGMRTIANVSCEDGLHWKHIPSSKPSFDDLLKSANSINKSFDFEALTKRKDWDKTHYRQFLDILVSMNVPVCDRCGTEFTSIDEWNTDRAVVIDSLTGLSTMSMDLTVGSKPVKSRGDWGIAMDNLERFIRRMCEGTTCHFVLTSHLEREKDEVSGMVQLMPSTLGQKLPPKIPPMFDDVVQTIREKDQFRWSTAAMRVDLKSRNLRIADDLPPSFKELISSWVSAGGIITPTTPALTAVE